MKPTGRVTQRELVALRRDIHQHPEMGFQETRTSALVQTHLERLGLTPKVLAKTGVTALIDTKKPGNTLMIRCDLDALPIQEDPTDLQQHPGLSPRQPLNASGEDLIQPTSRLL